MKTRIRMIQDDITRVSADAIVNAANTTLLGGGGVDGAIHRAAGPRLLAECATLGGCATGQARITKGYDLKAKFVIHTVGPVWKDGKHGEERLLADCYRNSLELARQNSLRTIAFPSISTGAYRFPVASAAEIALKTLRQYLSEHPDNFEEIILVLFSPGDLVIYQESFEQVFRMGGNA